MTENGKRVVVVTGASSGVGAATAVAFGALGWSVAIGARRSDRLAETAAQVNAAGGKAFAHDLDVTQPESVDAFFAAAESALGSVDTVVSNAGIGRPGLLHEVKLEDLRAEIETNLFGTMLVARRALPSMIDRHRGDLVFISSMSVAEQRPMQTGYTATKAGVEGMASILRKDLEGTGVRSTVVRLGATRSDFGLGWEPDVLLRVIETWQRWGFMRHMEMLEPEEVAGAIVAIVTAPPAVSHDIVQLNPEGSSRG
jgi:NADP-dependent 3-hydroxy acid dehydrogenase YdfG